MSTEDDTGKTATIELHAEDLSVGTRRIETGRVRVALRNETVDHAIEVPLSRESIEVERVCIGRVVEVVPEIRQEGDVTIYPVMEEVIVTERRLVLREEVRVRRVRTTEVHRETVRLSRQTAQVTRTSTATGGPAAEPAPDNQNLENPVNNGEHR